MIILLLATAGVAALTVYIFRAYLRQQVASAELAVHAEYSMLVEGLDKDANTLKSEILGKYDAALRKLVDSVHKA
jgi:hypothetical protein